jgi:hypothetical protein
MTNKTRGGLVPAEIYEIDESGSRQSKTVRFHFNPTEYTITYKNSFKTKGAKKGSNNRNVEACPPGLPDLSLPALWFDAYEQKGGDLKKVIEDLESLAYPVLSNEKQYEAPMVKFEWGPFNFSAVITELKINYVLFRSDGTPVRAKVNVNLMAIKDPKNLPRQNPTSGGGPIERVWSIVAGDRLDAIAAEVYGDATLWRRIAEHNRIDDPFALQTGRYLTIPPRN